MKAPVLYTFRRCPYAMRARLALAVSRLTCEIREVKLSAKPEALLRASPKGTVPVLVLPDGQVIDQSLDVMRHALAANDPEGWLERDDPALIAANDGPFKRDLDRYKYPGRYPDDEGDTAAYRAAGLAFLQSLDERLATSPFLLGEARGLADAALVPFVRQFVAVDATWFEAQALPHLKAWLAGWLENDLFAAILFRLPPWSPDDTAPVFWP